MTLTLSRRGFIGTAVGGVLLSVGLRAESRNGTTERLNAWLQIGNDDRVIIQMSQSEMGQGISTTLPAALADELGADWARVETIWSPYDPAFGHPQYGWMFTGNSESSSTFYPIMRTMGTAAREMLMQAAATQLGVGPETLTVRDGVIRHAASGRQLRFGEVAAAAGKLPVPSKPMLKPAADLRLIGKAQPRRDIPAKVDGSAVFGIDVRMPGMVFGAIQRAPVQGAALKSYDKAAILKSPGVVAVVEIASGLCVVADRYWHAKCALDAGKLVFEDSAADGYSTEAQRADYRAKLAGSDFMTKKKIGEAPAKFLAGAGVIEAIYDIPAQAHATMEPMNCTAHVTANRCELWVPTQGMQITHEVARQATGLRADQIVINRTYLGGGFGRRLLADFALIAIQVAQSVGKPVKVIWSREEDFAYDAFRPPMAHAIRAVLGSDGFPTAMAHKVISASHLQFVFPRDKLGVKEHWEKPVAPPRAFDAMAVEGLVETPYAIPDYLVEQHFAETPFAVSVWRTTGHGPNNFALESFIDELARKAGQDPIAYRLKLAAKDARAIAVLGAVAKMAKWGSKMPKGQGRGIALAKAFNGYVAQVVDVSAAGKDIKVRRVWTALDCGQTLDPGIAASNVEGGVVWGLSGLRTEASFKGGAVEQRNFDSFEPLHLWETPVIETQFIESGASVGGVGELGPVPTHAAFANAVFAATGERIRSLPITRQGFRLI